MILEIYKPFRTKGKKEGSDIGDTDPKGGDNFNVK